MSLTVYISFLEHSLMYSVEHKFSFCSIRYYNLIKNMKLSKFSKHTTKVLCSITLSSEHKKPQILKLYCLYTNISYNYAKVE